MDNLIPPWPLFSVFLMASLVLALTPGPGVAYIVARSLAQGRRAGLVSVAGVAFGNLSNAFAATAGLAVLFALSSLAFSMVKYAGALYLVYLGVQMLRSAGMGGGSEKWHEVDHRRLFRDGFWVALLNPKTTLFFAAFLPQFLTLPAHPMAQGMLLASFFVAIAASTDSVYALAAGTVAPRLRRAGAGSFGRRLGGVLFVGLGLFAAFAGMRGSK